MNFEGQQKPHPRHRSSVTEAHQIYLQYHREAERDEAAQLGEKEVSDGALHSEDREHKPVACFPMFHRVQKTGVIYATSRAAHRGFSMEATDWA